MSNIKLGLTLYCFTDEYIKGTMTLEDCFKKAAEIGATGFELVGTQMLSSYPYVSDEVLGELTYLTKKYGVQPVSYGANTDRGMLYDRNLTEDEMLQMAINDVKTANKLGCKIMRAQYLLSPKALGELAPYAELYDVKVGVEIHNPETPTTPIMREYLSVFQEKKSKYIGFIPDFGCFATKPNKPYWDLALKQGATVEMLEKAAELRYHDVPREEARKQLIEFGANEAALGAFENMYGFVTFYSKPDYEGLKEIMPYCVHFHGKFHYVDENLEEASIPYPEILKIIYESEFDGYIVSEFEGHGHYDAVEMTKRHLAMERKILDELKR